MSPSQGKKLALVAVVLSAAASYIKQARDPNQTASITRVVVGGIIVAMVLTLLADFAPEIAGPFSVLILVTALGYAAPELLATVAEGK